MSLHKHTTTHTHKIMSIYTRLGKHTLIFTVSYIYTYKVTYIFVFFYIRICDFIRVYVNTHTTSRVYNKVFFYPELVYRNVCELISLYMHLWGYFKYIHTRMPIIKYIHGDMHTYTYTYTHTNIHTHKIYVWINLLV